ncbi:MAG: hypothetical protein AVDCRST_MAG88-3736, partial [uncultured Thermomicrobiales bacterium]
EKLTALLGRPVRHISLGDEEYRRALVAAGLPRWYADGLVELFRFYREGMGAAVTDNVARITGHPARILDTYLAEQRAAFED